MLQISPVLAGTYDMASAAPIAATNINAASPATDTAQGVSGVDSRRYTQFDRSASTVSSTVDFSFDDFLDMVNPLQHIPVASSVYRSVNDQTINPVSQIAGDTLYGGVFGVASALIGAVGGVANSVMQAQTGKSGIGYAVASLFGDDTAKTASPAATPATAAPATALASAAPVTPNLTVASAAPAATTTATTAAKPSLAEQLAVLQAQALAQANLPPGTVPADAASMTAPAKLASLNTALPDTTAKAFPLDRSKQPYGRVMAPVGNMQDQNMIMALSQASNSMRMGHTIYTNKLMNGPHPMPAPAAHNAASAATATADNPSSAQTAAVTGGQSTPIHNPLPQNLIDDMMAMKGIGQYQSTALGTAKTGNAVDVTN